MSTDEVHGVVTPKSLAQHYMVVEAQNKINTLYSFVKTHLKSKMLAFFNSCKQVRFIYEVGRARAKRLAARAHPFATRVHTARHADLSATAPGRAGPGTLR